MLHEPGDSLKSVAIPGRVGMREASIDEFFGVIIVAARGVDEPQLTSWHMPSKQFWSMATCYWEKQGEGVKLEARLDLDPQHDRRPTPGPALPTLYRPV
jgi:hypothetical protein